jgi:hypothetical protein
MTIPPPITRCITAYSKANPTAEVPVVIPGEHGTFHVVPPGQTRSEPISAARLEEMIDLLEKRAAAPRRRDA